MTSVLLYSGGMDSFIANWLLTPDVLLYIRVGSRYEEKELKYVRTFIDSFGLRDKYHEIDLRFLRDFEMDNAHIPLRNLFFIEIASLFGDVVYLSALRGETSKDKSKKFRKKSQYLINYCLNDDLGEDYRHKVKVEFPFKKITKAKLLKKYLNTAKDELDVPILKHYLENFTVSCYSDTDDMCGCCMSCYRRWVAETLNDIQSKRYSKYPYFYYRDVLKSLFKGLWTKYKLLYKKSFYVNIPSNIGAYKANKQAKRMLKEKEEM